VLFEHLIRHWWMLTVRGAFAVILGFMAMIWPGITLLALAVVFGAYALVDGLFAGIGAIRAPSGTRTMLVVEAIIGIVFGLVTLLWPGITVLAITLLVGFWAIVSGITEIATAISLRREISDEWMYVAFGAVSVLFGLLVAIWPVSGALAVAWLIGVCAVIYGVFLIAVSLRLRTLGGGRPAPVIGGPGTAPL
jgi:uncharacterized membrane protein HdeD (DUF308 family)